AVSRSAPLASRQPSVLPLSVFEGVLRIALLVADLADLDLQARVLLPEILHLHGELLEVGVERIDVRSLVPLLRAGDGDDNFLIFPWLWWSAHGTLLKFRLSAPLPSPARPRLRRSASRRETRPAARRGRGSCSNPRRRRTRARCRPAPSTPAARTSATCCAGP